MQFEEQWQEKEKETSAQARLAQAGHELEERKKRSRTDDGGMAQYRRKDNERETQMEDYHQQEEAADERMHGVGRMTSGYGDVSFGVAANKKIVLSVSEKRRKDGKVKRRDSSLIEAQRAKQEKLGGFFLETNQPDEKESAAAYRGGLSMQPEKMIAAMKRAVLEKEQNATGRLLPFTVEKQKEQKKLREEQRRCLEADYQNAVYRQLYGQLEKQKEQIGHELVQDRQEEQRMLLWLLSTKEKAKSDQQKYQERIRYDRLETEAGQQEDGDGGENGDAQEEEHHGGTKNVMMEEKKQDAKTRGT